MFRCPKCNFELPANAQFCNNCGYRAMTQQGQPPGWGSPPTQPIGHPPAAFPPQQMGGARAPGPPGGPVQPGPPSGGAQRPSLMQRYQGGGQQGLVPPPPSQAHQPEQVVRVSTPPPPRHGPASVSGLPMSPPAGTYPGAPPPPVPAGPPRGVPQTASIPGLAPVSLSVESLAATSQAAEHWRNSWRDRQRAEAGPAVGVSRGQAVVPEPLQAMQHSIARMRTIVEPKGQQEEGKSRLPFRLSTGLMICLILGLGTYIISTFAPGAQNVPQNVKASQAALVPALMFQPQQKVAVAAGQAVRIHGDNFTPGGALAFTLGAMPINVAPTFAADDKDSFNATVPIPSEQEPGSYSLQVQDKGTGQNAFLSIQVLPQSKKFTNTTPLEVKSAEGAAISTKLTFKTSTGKDAHPQEIVLTNTGDTAVSWSATTVTEDGQSWLLVDDPAVKGDQPKGTGSIEVQGSDTINIRPLAASLKSSKKAYAGYVILMAGKNQLIIPVEFTVQDILEVVVSPSPLNLILSGGASCLPTTLTLINLSDDVVTWSANPDNGSVLLDAKQGVLNPSDAEGNNKVIKITCGGVKMGEGFTVVRVYNNGVEQVIPVNVRAA